ncbi:MAG: cupin domain-containing protein, partial [candidate division Zixibacteria bacterium]|nr:cupin domain-containing protein [Gammaproteobacteria bacterium]NIX55053.1 cupin domain-containing protein [candidate division Zixibacteria bacterium]
MTDCDSSILGNISARQFLQEYWQKKPCLIKQAIPDYKCPISPEELAGLACDESCLSRLIIQDNHDENKWQVQYGPFTDKNFSNLDDNHWSLLVSHVEQYVPAINSLLSRFNFVPSWRLDDVMISYAT